MADNRAKNGREGSPLWANINTSSALSFSPGQFQPLLVPQGQTSTLHEGSRSQAQGANGHESKVDGGELQVDHFIGQESPGAAPPVSHSNSSTSLFAATSFTCEDSFDVGYGSAPPTHDSSLLNSFHTTADQQANPVSSQSSVSAPVSQYYQPTHQLPASVPGYETPQYTSQNTNYEASVENSTRAVPMYNPAQPVDAQSTVPSQIAVVHYSPVVHHWFYCKKTDGKPDSWKSFSYKDSMTLEESFLNGEPDVIQTDGGRYDVCISERERRAVYWSESSCEIRRCSWFYRDDTNMSYIPYSEEIADELEEVYSQTLTNKSWHKKNYLKSCVDIFVFHSSNVFVQYSKGSFPEEFGAPLSEMSRPKVVKRGTDDVDSNISNGESERIDELIFVVHGIGPVCDLKFRGIVECVNGMRSTAATMLNSHFNSSQSNGKISRVEFLPIYWYDALRNEAVGVDRRLGNITLPSISKIRELTNEVLLDILFYNSPLYSQSILDKVGGELNRLYQMFVHRNPGWTGKVSLAGHSLGSLVLFDLLSMQGVPQSNITSVLGKGQPLRQSTPSSDVLSERSRSATPCSTPVDGKLVAIETMETVLEHLALTNLSAKFHDEQIDLESLLMCSEEDLKSIGLPLGPRKKILKFVAEREAKSAAACKVEQEPALPVTSSADTGMTQPADLSRQLSWLMETTSNTQVGYVSGLQGVGFPLVTYPQLEFKVNKFFALGSPIAMFLTIRGVESLSRDFHLPTCESMLNIFHPFDPVAYRMEPLINPSIKQKPVLIPHHKGRKRLHLELKENIVKVGSDIKDKVLKSLKSTWASINDFARAHTSGMAANQIADSEQELSDQVDKVLESVVSDDEKVDTSHSELESVSSFADNEVEVGQLNQGRRIDFVLQEAPFESFNDYLFALSSHLVYWESEDVSLMLMKEVYALMGVFPDVKDKTKQQQIHSLTEVAAKLNSSFSNQPLVTGASYPSQPPMTGASYPSQPPMTGASYPSQPPMAGASYPSQPPMTGASYPSQPPMTGASYPSQPPVTGAMSPANYFNQTAAPVSQAPSAGPPPMSGFVPSSTPSKSGFFPRH